MVVGAYFPELSGGSLQIRHLVRALGDRVACTVLTTSAVRHPELHEVDGVPVHRVYVDLSSRRSTALAAVGLGRAFVRLAGSIDLVQFNGFSRKSVLLMALARALGKPRIVKLTSVGQDDPRAIRARTRVGFAVYRGAEMFIGINPRQRELCLEAGIEPARFTFIPNGVDSARFRPATTVERSELRRALDLPPDGPLTLSVGFFSREKQPGVLFEAWRRLPRPLAGGLVFVGATQSRYHEVDPALAPTIRAAARAAGVEERLRFVERTDEIERYYRAVDAFALPSTREGMPNALLEAMASGLPCVTSRLPGVTDWFVDDGASGLLVAPGDVDALTAALTRALGDREVATALGRCARATVQARFPFDAVAGAYAEAYARLLGRAPARTVR
jgi:glycosyltransferase involved in cell wall biosynthesis